MKKAAIVTCTVLPEPDHDQEILLAALRDAGLDPSMLPWDDPSSDPGAFDVCVLRSCWDYYKHPGSFLKWIDSAASSTRLLNSAAVVRWNHHKRYLDQLRAAGVGVVPTVWFGRGEEADLGAVMDSRRWKEVVVKPSVSAASFKTRRFTLEDREEGREYLRDLLRDRDAMAQKYMPSVEGEGEKAAVWIDGAFTHAVRKSPRFSGGEESVSEAVEVSEEERSLGETALSRARAAVKDRTPLLYARVDMVRGAGGKLLISELELIEPSLFLLQHPPALGRLVAAIGRFAEGWEPEAETAPAESAGTDHARPGAGIVGPSPAGPSPPELRGRKFPGGGPGDRKPAGRKPLGWKPTGRKSGGRKRSGARPGEWKSSGQKFGDRKRSGWNPSGGVTADRKPGGWKPSGPKPGDGREGGWRPSGERPGGRKEGKWKPSGKRPGDRNPGGWKPSGGKPGGWKQSGGKPGDRRTGGRKSGGRKSSPRRPGGGKPS